MSKNSKFKQTRTKQTRRGGNPKSKGVSSKFNDKEVKSDNTNDPEWYGSNPQLLKDVASMPFSWATGAAYRLNNPLIPGVKQYIPGICAIALRPTLGLSEEPNSPLNMASISHYSYIRHANSGHANYDHPDLMLYICAVSQVFSYINFLMRTYGIASTYSYKNRYMPDGLLEASGVNARDVRSHLADFRAGINVLIMKAASLAAPKDMTIFNRQAMLYANVYCEGQSVKDQLYMYVPQSFLQYGLDSSGSGTLVQKEFLSELKTVDELLDYGYSLLNPITEDEDMGIMNGDIIKAYGDNIWKIATLPDGFSLAPIYDPLVLEQMKNATILPADSVSCNVKQSDDKAYLISKPTVHMNPTSGQWNFRQGYLEDRLITTSVSDPDPATVMEITRLTCGCENDTSRTTTTDSFYNISCGSEIAVGCNIWFFTAEGSLGSKTLLYNLAAQMNPDHQAGDISSAFRSIFVGVAYMSHFKFHPKVNYCGLDGEQYIGHYSLFDVDNYSVLTFQDVSKLHEAAILNELYVPSVGKLN